MSNRESHRAAREARREAARGGGECHHEDAIARYLTAFAYTEERGEERQEERDEKHRETRSGEAKR